MSRTVKLSSYAEETAIRAGNFRLLPQNAVTSFIVSQPANNFAQFTWIQGVQNATILYQELTTQNNTITLLKGTEFLVGIKVVDPSNVNDPNNTENIQYKWKRDDAYLFEVNKLNNGLGINEFLVPANDSIPDLSGRYTCEVINNFGIIESEPLTVNVVDALKHPKLLKNLIINGDGDGGLSNWTADNDIKVSPFLNNISVSKNFGSFRLGSLLMFKYQPYLNLPTSQIEHPDFYFSKGGQNTLFFPLTYKASRPGSPGAANYVIDTVREISVQFSQDDQYILSSLMPQIVLNEDYVEPRLPQEFAAFFPGIRWMDKYNKNTKGIGLYNEFIDYSPTYFTRNKLKFEKFGGSQDSSMTQIIDLTTVSDFVDGNVYGVKYLTSQFFAYVGIGITDYKIKVKTTGGERIFNYYIVDSEDLFNRLVKADIPDGSNIVYHRGTGEFFPRTAFVSVEPDSDIEIIPCAYDTTTISLDYLDESDQIIQTETVDGPTVRDIWAVKEKVYFPLTLTPLFMFLYPSANSNNIKIFDQVYTTTAALRSIFNTRGDVRGFLAPAVGASSGITNPQTNGLGDKNAKFLLNKFDFFRWGGAYPPEYWFAHPQLPFKGYYQSYKGLNDYGAAAMFGVGKNIVVPKNTRSVRVSVKFTHTSEIIKDINPQVKSWTSQEIYSDEFGNTTGTSARLADYGNPRCGITKMKFALFPNDPAISEEYPTYELPPESSTALGLQKAKYTDPNAFNTTLKNTALNYPLTLPQAVPQPPATSSAFMSATVAQSLVQAQSSQAYVGQITQNTTNTSSNPAAASGSASDYDLLVTFLDPIPGEPDGQPDVY